MESICLSKLVIYGYKKEFCLDGIMATVHINRAKCKAHF